MKKYLLALMFALGCAGAKDDSDTTNGVPTYSVTDDDSDDSVELGQAQQGIYANCAAGHQYGVQRFADGFLGRCNIFDSQNICLFPSSWGSTTLGYAYNGPFQVKAGTGWAGNDIAELNVPASAAVNFINDSMRTGWGPDLPDGPRFRVDLSTGGQAQYITMKKGTVTPGVTPSGNFTAVSNVMTMTCTSSAAFSEGFAGAARMCVRWDAIVDYNKIKTWAGAQTSQAMQNLIKKIFAVGAGNGFMTECDTCVADQMLHKDKDAATWYNQGEELGWQANFVKLLLGSDPSPLTNHLGCL